MKGLHICGGYFDELAYPLPPQSFMSSQVACVHTPAPSGYLEWHEWAQQASKTHEPIRCPRCLLWAIWLPIAIAGPINDAAERETQKFLKAYRRAHLKEIIAGAKRELATG